jgi:hypothetical protein
VSEAAAEQGATHATAERLPIGPERLRRGEVDGASVTRLHSMAGNGAVRRLLRGSTEARDRLAVVRSELDRPGEPLDPDVLADAERRLGRELPAVRLHRDSRAAEAMNATAFTVGRHVVLGPTAGEPASEEGRPVLMHELAHVLQQESAPASLALVPPGAPAERQAAAGTAGGEPAAGLARIVEKDLTRLTDAELQAEYELTQRWIAEHPAGADYDAGVSYIAEIERAVNDRAAAASAAPPPPTASTQQPPASGVGQESSSTPAPTSSTSATTVSTSTADVRSATSTAPAPGQAFNEALSRRAWPDAARALAEMSANERRTELEALTPEARQRLRTASAELDPSPTNPIVAEIEAVEQVGPQQRPATTTEAQPEVLDVAAMSSTDKLLRAWEYAKPHIGPDIRAQLEAMFTPESIAMMVGFALVYVAAQATPAGWVADGLALATLTISAIFVGRVVLDVADDLWTFFGAISATTDDELRADGAALAHAIAEGGIAIVLAILSRAIGGRGGGGQPYEGPPPTGYVEVLTNEAGLVRVPASAVVDVAPPSALQSLASYAVAAPPPGSGFTGETSESSGGGGSSRPQVSGAPRGPEVFDEISNELDLDPATLDTEGDAAAAASDARSAGFVGPQGQPGTVDLAVQPHSTASEVRGAYGVSGADVQSAHVGPTSFLRDAPRYSRGQAQTVLLERSVHGAFDRYWKDWAMDQRRMGNTTCTVSQLYSVMLDAIDQIPGLAQRAKNALAMRLQLEIFRDLGLQPTDTLELPYKNIPAAQP